MIIFVATTAVAAALSIFLKPAEHEEEE